MRVKGETSLLRSPYNGAGIPRATVDMKAHLDLLRSFEFRFARLDTLVLVEEKAGQVVIRATRNTFSDPAKLKFIHHLAKEGFIPDEFQWVWTTSAPGVQWVVDYSWLTRHPR